MREERQTRWRGPTALFLAWVVHDIEEAVAFPATCELLAERTGIGALRMTSAQSWTAVGLMGLLVGASCRRGVTTRGGSRLYRLVLAGLEAHVATHVLASLVRGGYTAGVLTAVPVMLPGALVARRELERDGRGLTSRDTWSGAALLMPAAAVCHVLARRLPF